LFSVKPHRCILFCNFDFSWRVRTLLIAFWTFFVAHMHKHIKQFRSKTWRHIRTSCPYIALMDLLEDILHCFGRFLSRIYAKIDKIIPMFIILFNSSSKVGVKTTWPCQTSRVTFSQVKTRFFVFHSPRVEVKQFDWGWTNSQENLIPERLRTIQAPIVGSKWSQARISSSCISNALPPTRPTWRPRHVAGWRPGPDESNKVYLTAQLNCSCCCMLKWRWRTSVDFVCQMTPLLLRPTHRPKEQDCLSIECVYSVLFSYVHMTCLLPWPWPDDLDMRTWPRYCEVVSVFQQWSFSVRLLKVKAQTGQTHRQTRPNALPTAFVGGNRYRPTALWRWHLIIY